MGLYLYVCVGSQFHAVMVEVAKMRSPIECVWAKKEGTDDGTLKGEFEWMEKEKPAEKTKKKKKKVSQGSRKRKRRLVSDEQRDKRMSEH